MNAYCENCDSIAPASFRLIAKDAKTGEPFEDLCCDQCHLVIATVSERVIESRLAAIVEWLEANQPDVFRRGLWDAINAADAPESREAKAWRLVQESGKTVHSSDCATSCAPAMEPSTCDCDEPQPARQQRQAPVGTRLRELIDRYWSLAYAEGKEGRSHDTEDGAAQQCRGEIEEILRAINGVQAPALTSKQINDFARQAGLPMSWLDDGKASAWPELERFARLVAAGGDVVDALGKCPCCGDGSIRPFATSHRLPEGRVVPLLMWKCDVCKAECAGELETAANAAIVRAARAAIRAATPE